MKKLKPVIICLIALTLNILLPLSQLRAAATDTADSIADGICSYKAGSGSIQHFIDTALVNGAVQRNNKVYSERSAVTIRKYLIHPNTS